MYLENFIDVKGYWISLYWFSTLQYRYVSSRHLVILLLCLINCSLLDIINKMDAHGIWDREGIAGPVVRLWHNCCSFRVREWSCVIGSASYLQTVSGILTSRKENKNNTFTRSILEYQVPGYVDLFQQRNYIWAGGEIEVVTTRLTLQ